MKERKKPIIAPSLNKFMHPRNPYRTLPKFKELALLYPQFRTHCTFDFKGKAFLDFKKPESLRALTTCLLHKDFQLKVSIPENRLVPTLPLRMNYLLWVEDLLNLIYTKASLERLKETVTVFDIGTGASCVYPLLGSRRFGWNFIATETDFVNFESAKKNIIENNMENKIFLKQSSDLFDIILKDEVKKFLQYKKNCKEESANLMISENKLLESLCFKNSEENEQEVYLIDISMCNPPFFSNEMEMYANYNSKKKTRSQPRSCSTGSSQERVTEGGELYFIAKIIDKSILYKNHIRIFSTLIGKKADLKIVINLIKEKTKGMNVSITDTEFCQGKTMRWGVAWSFSNASLDKVVSKKKKMSQKPYILQIPRSKMSVYSVQTVWSQIQRWLKDIKIKANIIILKKNYIQCIIKAFKPTWLHQRQKRRQKMVVKKQNCQSRLKELHFEEESSSNKIDTIDHKKLLNTDGLKLDLELNGSFQEKEGLKELHFEEESSSNKIDTLDHKKFLNTDGLKLDLELNDNFQENEGKNFLGLNTKFYNDNGTEKDQITSVNSTDRKIFSHVSVKDISFKKGVECYLKCTMELKHIEALINLRMNFISGSGKKDAMHQLLQYINNKIKNNN